jgi:retinol dehydrogenase-12
MLDKPDDMLGRVCIVTGASTGIGKEIARGLAMKRATVIVAARNVERGEAAAEDISDDAANPAVEFMKLDVSNARSVGEFGAAYKKKHSALHVLVNNAGVWLPKKEKSVDGIEMTFATNVLGYYRVTTELLSVLRASAPSRIVNVASKLAKGLDLDDVEYDTRKYDGVAAYAQSKQADRMLTSAFASRLRDTKVTANSLHPGLVASEIARSGSGIVGLVTRAYFTLAGITPARGAETAVWLASSRALASDTGGYYIKRKQHTDEHNSDEAAIDRLWALCEAMTKR